MTAALQIVFDGPPGPVSGRFVEVETPCGKSMRVGEWRQREDGYWALVLTADDFRKEPAAGDAQRG